MPARGVPLPGLKSLRMRALFTQEALAEQAKVDRNTIARLETGDRAALSTVRKLATTLGVSPDALMGPAIGLTPEDSQGKAGPAAPSKHTPAPLPAPWLQHGAGASL